MTSYEDAPALLLNLGEDPGDRESFTVEKGDKIAQVGFIIVAPISAEGDTIEAGMSLDESVGPVAEQLALLEAAAASHQTITLVFFDNPPSHYLIEKTADGAFHFVKQEG